MLRGLLYGLILLFSSASHGHRDTAGNRGQDNDSQSSTYSRQLQLVDSISRFIRNDLKLNVRGDFYLNWTARDDSMYVYLYVSRSDSVKFPGSLPRNIMTLWHSEDSATVKSNELNKQGFQTLVYKTAGNSEVMLSRKLLSYPDEAIAFILFHEAVHHHTHDVIIDYQYEEALCDALANAACVRFAEKTGMLNMQDVVRQKEIFEKTYAFLNKKRRQAEVMGKNRQPAFFRKCTSRINALVKDGNRFHQDRMRYQVNNAYFLRVEDYSVNYFEMKHQLGENLDIDKVITDLSEARDVKPWELEL